MNNITRNEKLKNILNDTYGNPALRKLIKIADSGHDSIHIGVDVYYRFWITFNDGYLPDGVALICPTGRGYNVDTAAENLLKEITGHTLIFHADKKLGEGRREICVV